jgi:hypothetical protein
VSALKTPYLDNEVVNGPREARQELAELKKLAATNILEVHCEMFGVPRDSHKWSDEQLIEWADRQEDADARSE